MIHLDEAFAGQRVIYHGGRGRQPGTVTSVGGRLIFVRFDSVASLGGNGIGCYPYDLDPAEQT